MAAAFKDRHNSIFYSETKNTLHRKVVSELYVCARGIKTHMDVRAAVLLLFYLKLNFQGVTQKSCSPLEVCSEQTHECDIFTQTSAKARKKLQVGPGSS